MSKTTPGLFKGEDRIIVLDHVAVVSNAPGKPVTAATVSGERITISGVEAGKRFINALEEHIGYKNTYSVSINTSCRNDHIMHAIIDEMRGLNTGMFAPSAPAMWKGCEGVPYAAHVNAQRGEHIGEWPGPDHREVADKIRKDAATQTEIELLRIERDQYKAFYQAHQTPAASDYVGTIDKLTGLVNDLTADKKKLQVTLDNYIGLYENERKFSASVRQKLNVLRQRIRAAATEETPDVPQNG